MEDVPALQLMHCVEPIVENIPIAQSVHAEPAVEYLPAIQGTHAVEERPMPMPTEVPAGHATQRVPVEAV